MLSAETQRESETMFSSIYYVSKTSCNIKIGNMKLFFFMTPPLKIFRLLFIELRSGFVFIISIQVFNNSPDETAYFRMILNRENVSNSVVMIQPSLISYSFHSGPEAALLDVVSISADKILLLDSYFTIVIFHGSTIAQWRKAGYHELPEHQVSLLLLDIAFALSCTAIYLGTPEVVIQVVSNWHIMQYAMFKIQGFLVGLTT